MPSIYLLFENSVTEWLNIDYNIGAGISYMVHERVQLDAAIDIDICNPAHTYALSLGIAWQINKPREATHSR